MPKFQNCYQADLQEQLYNRGLRPSKRPGANHQAPGKVLCISFEQLRLRFILFPKRLHQPLQTSSEVRRGTWSEKHVHNSTTQVPCYYLPGNIIWLSFRTVGT